MTEQSIEPPSFKRFKISRNLDLSKFKSKHYEDSLIFHPSDETTTPNLLIEVINNRVLTGVIPCANKDFMSLNIPVIGARFKKDNNYRSKEKDGISIYELEGDFEPQTVCDFVKGMTTGDFDVSPSNAIKFCYLADFWNHGQILEVVKSFVDNNMENVMLVDAWNFGENFVGSCSSYVKNNKEFIDEIILTAMRHIGFEKFSAFIDLCKSCGVDKTDILLITVEWFKHNSKQTEAKELFLASDFSEISNETKMRIYIDISTNVEPSDLSFVKKLGKRILEGIELNVAETKLVYSERVKYRMFSEIVGADPKSQQMVNTKTFEVKMTGEDEDEITRFIATSPEVSNTVNEFSWTIELDDQSRTRLTDGYSISVGIVNTNAMSFLSAESSSTDSAAYRLILSDIKLNGIKAQTWVGYEGSVKRLKSSFRWKSKSIYGELNDETAANYKNVEVKFQQEKRQLEFFINGKSLGVVYSDIRAGSYRLFVDVEGGPARITILDH